MSVALPALRVVRIVRVASALRGLRLLQTVATLNRGTRAIGHIVQRGRLGYALLLTVIVTLTAAAAAYYVEQGAPGATIQTPSDAVWWAATLVTTMNSPLAVVTAEGRVVGLLLRIYALAISGYLTATIAAYLFVGAAREDQSDAHQAELRELREEVQRLARIVERTTSAEPPAPDSHPATTYTFRR